MTTENGDVSNYRFPSVELLEKRNDGKEKISIEEIAENENRLKQALEQLGIKIARIETIIGAAITRYEITLLPGYKFSKIKRIEAELALPVGVLRGRIAEIDPFRPAIIIEIPNTNRGTVSMYSLIQSETFRENKTELPLAIGQTVENEPFILDLTEISHLLIAGATGQGKSVALHAMITSLLYSKQPTQLKFVMIDPKRIEFTPYGKIERHFLAKMESEEAIITDPYKAVDMLNILCLEMDNRLELQKETGVRNIVEYNEKFTSQRLAPPARTPLSALHCGGDRRVCRPHHVRPQDRESRGTSGPDGTCRRYPPDYRHAATQCEGHYGPDQGQLPGSHCLPCDVEN